jgi:hypothetical protein
MKFKSKRHLILTLKKKSGVELSHDEVKELMGLEPKKEEEVKPEDKKPQEEAKACDDKPKEEEKKVEEKADPAAEAPKAMSMEDLGSAIAALQENMNMLMEALATIMEGNAAPAPADEAKAEDKPEEEKEVEVEVSTEDEEEEMSEDEMEKELEKTIAELESIA